MDGRKRVWMKRVLKTAERKKNLNFESDYFKGFYSRGGRDWEKMKIDVEK